VIHLGESFQFAHTAHKVRRVVLKPVLPPIGNPVLTQLTAASRTTYPSTGNNPTNRHLKYHAHDQRKNYGRGTPQQQPPCPHQRSQTAWSLLLRAGLRTGPRRLRPHHRLLRRHPSGCRPIPVHHFPTCTPSRRCTPPILRRSFLRHPSGSIPPDNPLLLPRSCCRFSSPSRPRRQRRLRHRRPRHRRRPRLHYQDSMRTMGLKTKVAPLPLPALRRI